MNNPSLDHSVINSINQGVWHALSGFYGVLLAFLLRHDTYISTAYPPT